jgi:hypothetical protein
MQVPESRWVLARIQVSGLGNTNLLENDNVLHTKCSIAWRRSCWEEGVAESLLDSRWSAQAA